MCPVQTVTHVSGRSPVRFGKIKPFRQVLPNRRCGPRRAYVWLNVCQNSGTVHQNGKTITRFDVWMRRGPSESMRVRANKFREVEGEGAAWYASRTEAVGLGRVVPSSFY